MPYMLQRIEIDWLRMKSELAQWNRDDKLVLNCAHGCYLKMQCWLAQSLKIAEWSAGQIKWLLIDLDMLHSRAITPTAQLYFYLTNCIRFTFAIIMRVSTIDDSGAELIDSLCNIDISLEKRRG